MRPRFGPDLVLTKAYHPVLMRIKENRAATSAAAAAAKKQRNDAAATSLDHMISNTLRISKRASFVLLTGANMSGKSTLLKQLGNLQVMAQCGSFVPVEDSEELGCVLAQFNLKKRIFTISGDFSSEVNSSSFEHEMTELVYLLHNLDEDALVLIDELCRNTNYYEGLANLV